MKNLMITVFAIASLLSFSAMAGQVKVLKCDSNASKSEVMKVEQLVDNASFWYGPKSKCVKTSWHCVGMYDIAGNFTSNTNEKIACTKLKDKIDEYLVSNDKECKSRGEEAWSAARTQYYSELSSERTRRLRSLYSTYKTWVDEWDSTCAKYKECQNKRNEYKRKVSAVTSDISKRRSNRLNESQYKEIRSKHLTSKCCVGSSCKYL